MKYIPYMKLLCDFLSVSLKQRPIQLFYGSLLKVSLTLSRCTPRCVPAVCSRWTREDGTNGEGIHTFQAVLRIRPGLGQNVITICPGYASVRFVHSRCSTGGATVCPSASGYTTALPRHRRQSPGVTTTSHGSRTAKPRCYMVAY